MIKQFTAIFAIIGIVIIEAIALLHGINGVALATSLSVIGTICGYAVGTKRGVKLETSKRQKTK